jgi:hypothetical protein
MKGQTYSKGKCVKELRLSGAVGFGSVSVPGGHAPPDRRLMSETGASRDMSKAGVKVQEPEGGFEDENERLRMFGLIP